MSLDQGDPPLQPMTGSEYFERAIGSDHKPATYGKHQASHPVTIRRVYEEALTRFPEAADVIASLVFFKAVDRNRDEWLAQIEKERQSES